MAVCRELAPVSGVCAVQNAELNVAGFITCRLNLVHTNEDRAVQKSLHSIRVLHMLVTPYFGNLVFS